MEICIDRVTNPRQLPSPEQSLLVTVCQAGFRPVFYELDLVVTVLGVILAREDSFQTITMTDGSMFSVEPSHV